MVSCPYILFWNNAQTVGGTITGDWEDTKIIISQDMIGRVLGVQVERLEYSKNWEQAHWPTVDAALYGARRPEADAGNFLKAAKMRPLWRMFHNLLFHIVFSRRGEKDNVPSKDRFVLYNMFLRVKINLPSLILSNWIECLKQRSFNKVTSAHSIPYTMIFQGS